ncbi:hypothetical protein VNI00_009502 [Paramarasmius palmivorus]|uniref:cAMP-dependent protein kinase n=1 Tax=Paramarasmius palmivorus TaxID=297713 RepID=A0AAW0CLQ7_9AGAR
MTGRWLARRHTSPPELIEIKEHDNRDFFFGPTVDWYAAGIIVYEMATRTLPFDGKTDEDCGQRVLRGEYRWPRIRQRRIGKTMKAFVDALLEYNPAKRLGMFGVQEIMDHPWLKNIDWVKIVSREYLVCLAFHLFRKGIANIEPGSDCPQRSLSDTELASTPASSAEDDAWFTVVKPEYYLRHDKRFRDRPEL